MEEVGRVEPRQEEIEANVRSPDFSKRVWTGGGWETAQEAGALGLGPLRPEWVGGRWGKTEALPQPCHLGLSG